MSEGFFGVEWLMGRGIKVDPLDDYHSKQYCLWSFESVEELDRWVAKRHGDRPDDMGYREHLTEQRLRKLGIDPAEAEDWRTRLNLRSIFPTEPIEDGWVYAAGRNWWVQTSTRGSLPQVWVHRSPKSRQAELHLTGTALREGNGAANLAYLQAIIADRLGKDAA